jgi:superfamily I DNA/RNA helicase
MDQWITAIMTAYDHRLDLDYWFSHGFYSVAPDITDKHRPFCDRYDQLCQSFSMGCQAFFEAIQHDKSANDWMDYDDILIKSYQLLANADGVRHQLQSDLAHIFVDEFQDTSPIQWKIISLLCHDHDPFETKKLWLVGDRCQAIYGFRGADDKLMEMVLSTEHPNLQQVKNTANYRSHPAIVGFINELFDRLFTDQGERFLRMVPKKQTTASASVTCELHDDPSHELNAIATAIRRHHNAGIPMNDMAILVRKNADIQRVRMFLDAIQLPCQLSKGAGLCELDAVQVVICFLIGLLAPNNDVAWLSIAQDILRVDHATMAAIQQRSGSVRDALGNHPQIALWDAAITKGPVANALCALVWQLPMDWSDIDATAIDSFLALFQSQWEQTNTHGVLKWLALCLTHPKALSSVPEPNPNAVHIMTLHAAKGLEFSVVVVPFIDAPFNMGAQQTMLLSPNHGMGLSIPTESKANVIRSAIYNGIKPLAILEELRLFYVTLTRAKSHILLTGRPLKRKNTSRLSLCLPHLIQDTEHCYRFDFNYEGAVVGSKPLAHKQPPKPHAPLALLPIAVPSASPTWSVSQLLDAIACPKTVALHACRPLEIVPSPEQVEGERMHQLLAQVLIQKKCHWPEAPEWLARVMASDWYQRMVSQGELMVETPFEYHTHGHTIRGRFDAVWFSPSRHEFEVFDFKRQLSSPSKRHHQQVHLYATILGEMHPKSQFNRCESAIIDLQSNHHHPVKHIVVDVADILKTIQSGAPNPTACATCPYNTMIDQCSKHTIGFNHHHL